MRIAYLSPLPPVRSGVSEYSADLVPELARLAELRLFAAPPATGAVAGIPIEPPEAFDREAASGSGIDVAIHHLGNNLHHRFVAERVRVHPGILVLHDLVLHHYWIEETLACGRGDDYVALMTEVYGELGRGAALARLHSVSSEVEYFVFPLFEPLAAASRAVLVHNRRAAERVRERIEGVPVAVVPMGIPEAAADPLPSRDEARRALGLGGGEVVAGLFGFMTPIKRPVAVLRACARAARSCPELKLVVLGEVAPVLDLEGEARALGVADRVVLTGYLPYDQAKRWIAAADLFLNLRYPTAGETSASLLRLLGWGKPVIVSDYAQFREIPAEAALRVSLGPSEEAELVAVLDLVASRPDVLAALGAAAARFVAREHTLARAAAVYAEVAAEVLERGPASAGRIRDLPGGRTSRTPRYPAVAVAGQPIPARVAPGTAIELRARLRNTGDTTWLRHEQPEAGDAAFSVCTRDAGGRPGLELGRALLPREVAPGEEIDVACTFSAPVAEGSLEIVADVRILGWGSLHTRGSPAAVYRLEITAGGGS